MRRWTFYAPLIVISLACFITASQAENYAQGFVWALAGALVPIFGALYLIVKRLIAWRSMGQDLGLIIQGDGAYPDMAGLYRGKRLLILRRIDPYARGARDSTVLRVEGHPEIRLPGTVARATTVEGVLAPLFDGGLPEDDGSGGGVQARQESDDRAAIE